MPLLTKPPACIGCSLETRGEGFAPADGPIGAWLLLVGEGLGKVEALTGRPFMGDAGGMLTRLLNLLGWTRDAIRIHNVINCHPPGDWLEGAPWYHAAVNHCRYLDATLAEGPKVVVTVGGVALKRVMGLLHHKKIRVQDFHGAILRDPTDRFWVVPTFHPSFLQRGAHNLIGTVLWDLQRAIEARDHGKPADSASLIVDPPVEWFKAWVDQTIAARQQEPDAYPVSSDVETPDKAGGKDEGEITADDKSFQILRINVSAHTDEGITVPFAGPYIDELRRLHQSPGPIWQWNREYDFVRMVAASIFREEDSPRVVDLMWLWHFLQSDVPRGLGFVSPLYSTFGPWKHIADSDPGRYGAIDGLQTHRCGFGITSDLIQTGQLAQAMRHVHVLHTYVLRPAQLVGVKIDRQRLLIFKQELADKAREKLALIQSCVPESLAPLTPKGGLTKPPAADVLHVKATAFTRKGTPRAGKPVAEIKQELYARARVIEKVVLKEVFCCKTCGATEVHQRHRCAPPGVPHEVSHRDDRAERPAPQVVLDIASVRRWFWQEPFNPDSVPQILSYIKYRKHKPGRAKKSKAEESTNRETLERLSRTGDPFYTAVLDYRAINKVKGTYVEGTERRLDTEDRLHPVPTFKPSTMRLSYVNPNITNVVADKGGESLASGFRRCVVASPGCRLLEVDFSAIEAVETGYCARDPKLIRLARLGIHSYLIAARLNDAPDLAAADADIAAHLKEVKKKAGTLLYDQIKHTVYGVFYGQTPIGLQYTWPKLYPTQKSAEELVEFMFAQLPSVRVFQQAVCNTAAFQHCLGGPGEYHFQPQSKSTAGTVKGHPYGYKHWFWSIYTYRRLNAAQYYRLVAKARREGKEPPVVEINGQYFRMAHGPDANRAIAFYPQSIARGVLTEALLRLLIDPDSSSYIGDTFFGRTPLRAPIHDSGLFDVPMRQWDRVVERVTMEMQRPILEQPIPAAWGMGSHLAIGVAAKGGLDWQATEDLQIDAFSPEWAPQAMEIEDEEDWADLGRAI